MRRSQIRVAKELLDDQQGDPAATRADLGRARDQLRELLGPFNQGDFSLAPGAYPVELESAAVRLSGDPVADISGDPRPDTVGSEDFAGADRL